MKDETTRHRWEASGLAAVIAVIVTAVAYLVISGETYGTLKTTVDQHTGDISTIKRTLQDPDDPSKGIVPMLNKMSSKVDDLHHKQFGY